MDHRSFMYVLTPNVTAVNVVSLLAPGQAKIVQKLDLAKPAKAAGLTVSKCCLCLKSEYLEF